MTPIFTGSLYTYKYKSFFFCAHKNIVQKYDGAFTCGIVAPATCRPSCGGDDTTGVEMSLSA